MTEHGGCADCTYVANAESIIIPREIVRRATPSAWDFFRMIAQPAHFDTFIVSLGRFTLMRWSGHAMWYAFFCRGCVEVRIDYLHGHHHHIDCRVCGWRWYVRSRRFYEETGSPMPLFLLTKEEVEVRTRAMAQLIQGAGSDPS